MKKYFEKYPAIISTFIVLIISIVIYYLFSTYVYDILSLQFMISFFLVFTSLPLLFLSIIGKSDNKTKLIYIVASVISIMGYIDLVHTEPTYELSDNNVEMIQISDYYVVYVENKELADIKTYKLKFDTNNPIKAYKMIKTDRFGTNFVERTVIKSDLMSDYLNLNE